MRVSVDTKLGHFTFEVSINPDKKRFDVTILEPWNGDDGFDTRLKRILKLVGHHKFQGKRELQAYGEALIVGAIASFVALCQQMVGYTSGEDIDEYDLGMTESKEILEPFKTACEILHTHLMIESDHT